MDAERQCEETLEFEGEVMEEEGVKDRLKKIRKELEACRREKEEYLAGWQRAKADLINARKEEERARGEFIKFAEEKLVKELFALADSLEQAMKTEGKDGFENIYKQLQSILKAHGVEKIESEGKEFDPLEHEALTREEVKEEEKDNKVVEELSRGYKINGRVIRPARVKVGHYRNYSN